MDFNEKIFDNAKVKAPDNFVADTMKYIREQERIEEIQYAKKENSNSPSIYIRLGKALITAAILLVIFNVLPVIQPINISFDKYRIQDFNLYVESKSDDFFRINDSTINEMYNDFKNNITNKIQGE